MNLLKRTLINLKRNLDKSILLFFVIVLIGTAVSASVSVSSAIRNTESSIRRKMNPLISIILDRNLSPSIEMPVVTEYHVNLIGELDHVRLYDYLININLFNGGIATSTFDLTQYEPEGKSDFLDGSWKEEGSPARLGAIGVHKNFIHLEHGIISLDRGRQFSSGELTNDLPKVPIILSVAVADQNNLTIGSTIEIFQHVEIPNPNRRILNRYWFLDEYIYEKVTIQAEIIGLFNVPIVNEEMLSHLPPWEIQSLHNDRTSHLNFVYMPNWAIRDMSERKVNAIISSWNSIGYEVPRSIIDNNRAIFKSELPVVPLFILNDVRDLDEFKAQASHLLPEHHEFIVSSNSFDDVRSAMETLTDIANWIIIGSIGASVIIITTVILLFVKDRKKEFGIYLSLGEKRKNIVFQVLFEVFLISLLGITTSLFIGILISNQISHEIVLNELNTEQEQNRITVRQLSVFDFIGVPAQEISIDEMMEMFDSSMESSSVIQFYVTSLGTIGFASVLSVVYMFKLEPKKILLD